MERVVLNVEGMSCQHCVKAINKAVAALDGVTEITVNLEEKTVTVSFDASRVTLSDIRKEIEDQGYDIALS
jgi:copper chaperone